MCGIVGAVSTRNIVPVLIEGLKRLEYRGYDSCGVAVHQHGGLLRARSTERVAELERNVAADAIATDPRRHTLDRTGTSLASGGDNDLVFTALHAGGEVAYFPELRLTHLIPAGRLAPDYLTRLNRGIICKAIHKKISTRN